jgi:hypothetical protein
MVCILGCPNLMVVVHPLVDLLILAKFLNLPSQIVTWFALLIVGSAPKKVTVISPAPIA